MDEGATFNEQAVKIIDEQKKVLRKKNIKLLKVLWRHQGIKEKHESMKICYEPITLTSLRTEVLSLISRMKFRLRGVDCKDPILLIMLLC